MPNIDNTCSGIRSRDSKTASPARSITHALLMVSCNPSFSQTSSAFCHKNNTCFVSSGPFKHDGYMGETFICLLASVTRHGRVPCKVRQMKIFTFAGQDNCQILPQMGLRFILPIPFGCCNFLPCCLFHSSK